MFIFFNSFLNCLWFYPLDFLLHQLSKTISWLLCTAYLRTCFSLLAIAMETILLLWWINFGLSLFWKIESLDINEAATKYMKLNANVCIITCLSNDSTYYSLYIFWNIKKNSLNSRPFLRSQIQIIVYLYEVSKVEDEYLKFQCFAFVFDNKLISR